MKMVEELEQLSRQVAKVYWQKQAAGTGHMPEAHHGFACATIAATWAADNGFQTWEEHAQKLSDDGAITMIDTLKFWLERYQ